MNTRLWKRLYIVNFVKRISKTPSSSKTTKKSTEKNNWLLNPETIICVQAVANLSQLDWIWNATSKVSTKESKIINVRTAGKVLLTAPGWRNTDGFIPIISPILALNAIKASDTKVIWSTTRQKTMVLPNPLNVIFVTNHFATVMSWLITVPVINIQARKEIRLSWTWDTVKKTLILINN